jgi:hypothetical protein
MQLLLADLDCARPVQPKNQSCLFVFNQVLRFFVAMTDVRW